MTDDEIRRRVIQALCDVAPEVRPDEIDPRSNLREQLDLDSVDFMNFVIGLHDVTGVDVPEADYGKLGDLDACVAYLRAKGV